MVKNKQSNKEKIKNLKEAQREEDSKPHFAKVVDYAPKETWRTDILIGQKDSDPHGHIALSGAAIWYLRDEKGKEIIKEGNLVKEENQKKDE